MIDSSLTYFFNCAIKFHQRWSLMLCMFHHSTQAIDHQWDCSIRPSTDRNVLYRDQGARVRMNVTRQSKEESVIVCLRAVCVVLISV